MDLCKKKESSGSAEDVERQYGRIWIWTAVDAPTRLIISFWIGGRELKDARRMLKAKFAICVACYNLIRPHESLSRGKDLIFRPKTPAMAANVVDHRWTFSERLAYPSRCQ